MYRCIVIFLGQCIDTFKFCIVPSLLLAWYGPFVLSPVFLAVLEGKHGKIKFAILEHRHLHFHLTFAFGHEKAALHSLQPYWCETLPQFTDKNCIIILLLCTT